MSDNLPSLPGSLLDWAHEHAPIHSELPALRRRRAGLAAALKAQAAELAKLRTVMAATAEEIHAYWEAHCDAEGYGPANLMRRLEEGIAVEYGYTAGAFAKQSAELATLRARLVGLEGALRRLTDAYNTGSKFSMQGQLSDEAKSAAWAAARNTLESKT